MREHILGRHAEYINLQINIGAQKQWRFARKRFPAELPHFWHE